jgi:hypothetical protein
VETCEASVPDAKISPPSLSVWTTKWEKIGLVKKEGQRVTQLFSLVDFGLNVPKIADGKSAKKATQQPELQEPAPTEQTES